MLTSLRTFAILSFTLAPLALAQDAAPPARPAVEDPAEAERLAREAELERALDADLAALSPEDAAALGEVGVAEIEHADNLVRIEKLRTDAQADTQKLRQADELTAMESLAQQRRQQALRSKLGDDRFTRLRALFDKHGARLRAKLAARDEARPRHPWERARESGLTPGRMRAQKAGQGGRPAATPPRGGDAGGARPAPPAGGSRPSSGGSRPSSGGGPR